MKERMLAVLAKKRVRRKVQLVVLALTLLTTTFTTTHSASADSSGLRCSTRVVATSGDSSFKPYNIWTTRYQGSHLSRSLIVNSGEKYRKLLKKTTINTKLKNCYATHDSFVTNPPRREGDLVSSSRYQERVVQYGYTNCTNSRSVVLVFAVASTRCSGFIHITSTVRS